MYQSKCLWMPILPLRRHGEVSNILFYAGKMREEEGETICRNQEGIFHAIHIFAQNIAVHMIQEQTVLKIAYFNTVAYEYLDTRYLHRFSFESIQFR